MDPFGPSLRHAFARSNANEIALVLGGRGEDMGRELSAWHSSGNRNVLLGISKRGDRYLRTLLIHGARAALRTADRGKTQRSAWLSRLRRERGPNVAAVALANKNARIVWALLVNDRRYDAGSIRSKATRSSATSMAAR